MPNGQVTDFWNYVHDMGDDLHKGKPKKFFFKNQAYFMSELAKLKQSRKRIGIPIK